MGSPPNALKHTLTSANHGYSHYIRLKHAFFRVPVSSGANRSSRKLILRLSAGESLACFVSKTIINPYVPS